MERLTQNLFLFTIANDTKIKILETFQRKAIKLALRLKNQTSTTFLNELMYAKSLSFRLNVAHVKLWNVHLLLC